MEHHNIFTSEDGIQVEMKIKTEHSSGAEMEKMLSFLAQSSHRFYLEAAEKISNML